MASYSRTQRHRQGRDPSAQEAEANEAIAWSVQAKTARWTERYVESANLARRGYDAAYGARPLKRLIQREIADKLALAVLEGRYGDGSTVTVDVAPPLMRADGALEPSDGLVLS